MLSTFKMRPIAAMFIRPLALSARMDSLTIRRNHSNSIKNVDIGNKVNPVSSAIITTVNDDCIPKTHLVNSRLEGLRLNADYLAGIPIINNLELPSHQSSSDIRKCPDRDRVDKAKVDPVAERSPLVDPITEEKVEKRDPMIRGQVTKYAHRMLRIRKRKMKVHRRKKRNKAQAARIRKVIFTRDKRKECAFRSTLIERVRLAKLFDAEEYVKGYLEDLHTKITPQTFKGKRHPTWLVEELMEKEKLTKRRKAAEKLDVITGEPLVREGETVEQFVKRMEEREKNR